MSRQGHDAFAIDAITATASTAACRIIPTKFLFHYNLVRCAVVDPDDKPTIYDTAFDDRWESFAVLRIGIAPAADNLHPRPPRRHLVNME